MQKWTQRYSMSQGQWGSIGRVVTNSDGKVPAQGSTLKYQYITPDYEASKILEFSASNAPVKSSNMHTADSPAWNMAMAIIYTAYFITHKLNVLTIKDKKHKTIKQTVQRNTLACL